MSSWFGIRWWTVIQFYKDWCVCVCARDENVWPISSSSSSSSLFLVPFFHPGQRTEPNALVVSRILSSISSSNGTRHTFTLALAGWLNYPFFLLSTALICALLDPIDHRLNNKLSTQSQFTWNSKHTWSLHSICPQFTPILLSYRPPHLRILSSSSLSNQHSSLGSCTK